MAEAHETVLRKSLDEADRRRRLSKASLIIGIVFLAAAELGIVPAFAHLRAIDNEFLYAAIIVVAGAIFISGLALIIIAVSHRNTQLILRAIQLASEAAGTQSEPPSSGRFSHEG
jgi:protein-S-isoprenylcysteine O-methyltransferase Ste14